MRVRKSLMALAISQKYKLDALLAETGTANLSLCKYWKKFMRPARNDEQGGYVHIFAATTCRDEKKRDLSGACLVTVPAGALAAPT
jgi:hypothetical protein